MKIELEYFKATTPKEQRFVQLGYLLLTHKFHYYVRGQSIIADEAYDKLEEEYKQLAVELNQKPTASNTVGFDMTRPVCRMIAEHLEKKYNGA